MQEKSDEKCRLIQRLDKLRVTLQLNWSEVAEKVGLSESMLYQVKAGKKNLSDKAIYRLEVTEKEAGLGPMVHFKAASALATAMGGTEEERQRNFEAAAGQLNQPSEVLFDMLSELEEIKVRVDSLHRRLKIQCGANKTPKK